MPSRGQAVLQLRAQLRRVDPVVWRRVLVPAQSRLGQLHQVLQAAMGWTDSHLHYFKFGELTYTAHYDDFDDELEALDEASVTVLEALGRHRRFFYEYDFGDSWEHDIVVEARSELAVGLKFAVCVDGQNACPPEDCGGPSGYKAMLEVLADPSDEEHEPYLAWVGGSFDPTHFDLAEANAALQRLR